MGVFIGGRRDKMYEPYEHGRFIAAHSVLEKISKIDSNL